MVLYKSDSRNFASRLVSWFDWQRHTEDVFSLGASDFVELVEAALGKELDLHLFHSLVEVLCGESSDGFDGGLSQPSGFKSKEGCYPFQGIRLRHD